MKHGQTGKFLGVLRQEAGFSQGDLAKHLGFTTNQSVSNWERSKSPVPMARLADICKFLGLSGMEKIAVREALITDYQSKLTKVGM